MKTKYTKSDALTAAIIVSLIALIPCIAFGLCAVSHFLDGKWFRLPSMLAVISVSVLLFLRVTVFFERIAMKELGVKEEDSK